MRTELIVYLLMNKINNQLIIKTLIEVTDDRIYGTIQQLQACVFPSFSHEERQHTAQQVMGSTVRVRPRHPDPDREGHKCRDTPIEDSSVKISPSMSGILQHLVSEGIQLSGRAIGCSPIGPWFKSVCPLIIFVFIFL